MISRHAAWTPYGKHDNKFGNEIQPTNNAGEALAALGLDWKVDAKPLFLETGAKAPANAVVRATDQAVLGVVGAKYHPIQNAEALCEFDDPALKDKIRYTRGWNLRGGSVVVLQAKVGDPIKIATGDEVERYLLYVTSHDGSINTRVIITPHRTVCANQLNGIFQSKYAGLAIKHTPNAPARLREATAILEKVHNGYAQFADMAKRLADVRFGQANMEAFVKELFPAKAEADVTTRTQNSRIKLMELFESGAGAELSSASGTAWGAFNALTEYVDHERGTRTKDEDQRGVKRLESIWFGSGANLKAKAWSLVRDYLR